MDKFAFDYKSLDNKINQKTFKYNDVKDKLHKVAFDVVKFDSDSNIEGLWKIEKDDQGEYIIAMYEDAFEKVASVKSDWVVLADQAGHNLSFFYKNEPVIKLASEFLGVGAQDADELASNLPELFNSNLKLTASLLLELTAPERQTLLSRFPELQRNFS